MNKNKRQCLLAVFGTSAVFSFALSLTSLAHSTTINVYTVPWVGCQGIGDKPGPWASCPLVQGADMPVGILWTVYFDYLQASGGTYTLTITKESYTGSVYSDYVTYVATATGSTDQYVSANQVKTNSSVYDYLEASILLTGLGGNRNLTMYGVAEVSAL